MSLRSSIRTLLTLGRGVLRGLPPAADDADPIELFAGWYHAAEESGMLLPDAMALATATPEGIPSVRMVLLKGVGPDGFVFYTNYGSHKAQELDANPHAALCFHWPVLERQVRVAGAVQRLSPEENEAYFMTRPRGSRIGAWASRQSEVLPSRQDLLERVKEYNQRFSGDDVPLPPFWGGYRLMPSRMEFWQGKADRLHDRLLFLRRGGEWTSQRLYP
ncbi:MAG: pyridoxamine 5'-phosphate oxidase [Gemmatimonadota bacterium]